jgi:hypothetical protein
MRPIVPCAALAAVILALQVIPATAHHSFATVYDSSKSITLSGTVTKIDWKNPHVYYFIDVKGADGKVTNYAVEGGTPNQLFRQGWRKDSLKVGDMVKVLAYPSRNGSNRVNGRQTTLPDGRKVFSGSPDDGGPTQ